MNRSGSETTYTARWIFPIAGPPINGGYMRVVDHRIVKLGSVDDCDFDRSGAIDLGDIAVLPRLVNAHTHLEFSDCKEVIGQPGIPLAQWIGKVIAVRGKRTCSQRDQSIRSGLAESAAAGVALIGDIATTPSDYPEPCEPRVISFAEVLGLSDDRARERLESAAEHATALGDQPSLAFGISPHAPYSTPLELVEQCVAIARQRGCPVAMHLAESPEERELLQSGTGRFSESLRGAGLWRDDLFPWSIERPIEALIALLAKSPRAILVHGNDLTHEEIQNVAGHDNLSVVYCPRTHWFFGYPQHPVGQLMDAGVRVAIGTDSRASNPDLSVWRELQFLLNHRQDLAPERILEMATLSGAEALLGAGTEFGKIKAGSTRFDSLVWVQTAAQRLDQAWHDFAQRELLCTPLPLRA